MRVEVVEVPSSFEGDDKIRLVHQATIRPDTFLASDDNTWDITVPVRDGKWSGPGVGRNSDGRRFIYFAWVGGKGNRFRRIKLYQDQVSGDSVRISGRMKDGSPACSTAIVILD